MTPISAIGAAGDYGVFTYSLSGGTWVINDPEPGIMRITLNGDSANAGTVAGRLRVFAVSEPIPQFTAQGRIAHLQAIVQPVSIPSGTALAEFRLGWREGWASYPSNDVDLYLISPSGNVNAAGATLRNPEKVKIEKPSPGTWRAIILGFEVYGADDKFEFRAALDGKIVK